MRIQPFETERLIIREHELSGQDGVHRYCSDPDVLLYMPWEPVDENSTRMALERVLAAQ